MIVRSKRRGVRAGQLRSNTIRPLIAPFGIATATIILALCACTGCSSSPTVKVDVLVKLDGEPMEGATVTLVGTGANRNRPAVGTTDATGMVRFTTFKAGDGVLPGEYKVLVSKAPSTEQEMMTEFDPNNPEDMKRFQLLESRGAVVPFTRTLLPRVYLNPQQTPLSISVPPSDVPVVLDLDSSLGRSGRAAAE